METITSRPEQWPLTSTAPRTRSRPLTVALWIVSAATAGMFVMAGVPKLAGAPEMVQLYEVLGVGQWFRYVTGLIEIVSGVALLVPALALFGALALAATMVGAILTHVFVIGGSPALPMILLMATSFIAWTRWSGR
jgi:uncharacterized membrane protein YphA (DoxX/SURF4 family)